MNRPPSVSIAIRAYRRRWVGEAIASVLAQTHDDLELLIYDDAGNLEDVARGFADGRVRYHRARQPLDAAGRYRAAVALCRGDYIGVLDDDDRYEPEFVARLVAELDADERVGMAVSRFVWDHDGRLVVPPDGRPAGLQEDAGRAIVDFRWVITPSISLLRRSVLTTGERHRPMPDGVAPDFFVNARAVACGWRFVLVDASLVVKRWHDSQLSRAGLAAHDRGVATWERLTVAGPEHDRLRRRHLARARLRRAGWWLLSRDLANARLDVRAARTADSGSWRWRRRALAAATRLPRLGRAGLRLWAALPRVRRRRKAPPEAQTARMLRGWMRSATAARRCRAASR